MSKKTFFAITAIVATGLLGLSQMGLSQHANAVSENANAVAQVISKEGSSPNQAYQTSCKETSPANECATNPVFGNGPFTSNIAKSVNGPN